MVVRAGVPAELTRAAPDALLGQITAGLTARFPEVMPVEVTADPPGVPGNSVRLVHAAIDAHGEGIAIETLLLRGGEVTCWVVPAPRYALELPVARRAMAGRPPLPADDVAPEPGVPVTEARLAVDGATDWVIVRHGAAAHAFAEPATGLELPPSALPMWMAAVAGLAPRPVPPDRRLLITTRPALDRLLTLPDPDDAAVRTALAAPDLTETESRALTALARGLVRRWSLEWAAGRDEAREPADDWSTARPTRRGRLEILDAGPDAGLWRVLTGLPEILTDDLPEAIALVRTAPSDVWHELTLTVAG